METYEKHIYTHTEVKSILSICTVEQAEGTKETSLEVHKFISGVLIPVNIEFV